MKNIIQKSAALKHIYVQRLALLVALIVLFSISSCELEDLNARDKFLGTWRVSELSSLYEPPPMIYTVNIISSVDDPDEVIISNFFNMGPAEKVYAFVSGNNITIPNQTICDGSITVSGSGVYKTSSNEINMTYIANDEANEEELTATLTKL
jgi:hypothetical protein